jgi:uncharacterized protein (DUF58 family)
VRPTVKAYALYSIVVLLAVAGATGLQPDLLFPVALILASITAASRGLAEREYKRLSMVKLKAELEPSTVQEGWPARISVRVANEGASIANILLREASDDPRAVIEPREYLVELGPGEEATVEFTVRGAPGLHVLGRVEASVSDPLGLFEVTLVVDERLFLYVIPATVEARDGQARYERHGVEEVYSRLYRGVSFEFYEIREYVPGDDPRRIVWSATARTGKLMVREDLVELSVRTHIVIDLSREMWIGDPGNTPGDHAMRVALTLARLVARGGSMLGFTVFDGEMWRVEPPRHGREAVQKLIAWLSGYDPLASRRRVGLYRAVRESSLYAGPSLLLVVTGPGVFTEKYPSEKLAEALASHPGKRLIVFVAPEPRSDRSKRILEAIRAEYTLRGVVGNVAPVLFVEGSSRLGEAMRVVVSRLLP